MARPGPEAVDPAGAPGGVVFHVYNARTGDLVGVDPVVELDAEPSADLLEAVATLDDGEPVVLVAYDGDTGRRFTPDQLAAAGLTPGQRL